MSSINENDKNIKKITRLELLKEVQDMVNHNLLCYSKDYFMNSAKEGHETEWERERQKSELLEEMIGEEKRKENLKIKNKGKEL